MPEQALPSFDLLLPAQLPPTEQIPPEWLAELATFHPDSYAYKEQLKVLTEFAMQGCVDLEPIVEATGQPDLEVPRGFTSALYLPEPTLIQTSEIEHKVRALDAKTDIISVPVIEYTSDTTNKIRVCDLRNVMKPAVIKLAPDSQVERDRLDEAFMMDVKNTADQGRLRNIVKGAPGVGYTKVPRSKIRGYYALVHDSSNGDTRITTIARLADCGNFDTEQALYSRVFAIKLEK